MLITFAACAGEDARPADSIEGALPLPEFRKVIDAALAGAKLPR